jgi:hypothetical protein
VIMKGDEGEELGEEDMRKRKKKKKEGNER